MNLSAMELANVEDLIIMPELNEDIIIDVLLTRYNKSCIYTNTDTVLLAINPFCSLPLYTETVLELYSSAVNGKELKLLPPHPWKTAAMSFLQMTNLMQEIQGLNLEEKTKNNQSILISGESGAGKTETTKIIMSYLASITKGGRAKYQNENELGIVQQQVLNSNPILEAFGNARTVRNDNSSRFGKYIKLLFSKQSELIGASLSTFLLETPRLVTQSVNERNFHIFYMLCTGIKNEEERQKLYLTEMSNYYYINQSNCYERHDGVSDNESYKHFNDALVILGFSNDNVNSLITTTIALLTMGNINFISDTLPSGEIITSPNTDTLIYVQQVASLLQIPEKSLIDILVSKDIIVAGESLRITHDSNQASESRDTLAKAIYSALFQWLLDFINSQMDCNPNRCNSNCNSTPASRSASPNFLSIENGLIDENNNLTNNINRDRSNTNYSEQSQISLPNSVVIYNNNNIINSNSQNFNNYSNSSSNNNFIGLLDIFGFESLEKNSFEQLLINYANECLQQQFNIVMIELEQQLYIEEEIKWNFVEFPSNKDCIDLIGDKRTSILSILLEACVAPSGNDTSFVNKLYSSFNNNPRMMLTPMGKANQHFGIRHFAGVVVYDSHEFVYKNKSRSFSFSELLNQSNNSFLSSLGKKYNSEKVTSGSSKEKRKSSFAGSTIASIFKESLTTLLNTISGTDSHYIRCLKPNADNIKNHFVIDLIRDQLQSGGIIQTISVIRAGFPVRFPHSFFIKYYKAILTSVPKNQRDGSVLETISTLVMRVAEEENVSAIDFDELQLELGVQIGKTKIFFRQSSFQSLQKLQLKCLLANVTLIQTCYRRYTARYNYQRMYQAAIKLHSIARKFTKRIQYIRHRKSAVILQSYIRRFLLKSKYIKILRSAKVLQLWWRFKLEIIIEQRIELEIHRNITSTILQQWWKRVRIIRAAWVEMRRRAALILTKCWKKNYPKLLARRLLYEVKALVIIKWYRKYIDRLRKIRAAKEAEIRRYNKMVRSDSFGVPLSAFFSEGSMKFLRANHAVLWELAVFYCPYTLDIPSTIQTATSNPASKKVRHNIPILPAGSICTLAMDWGLCPTVCGKTQLMTMMYSLLQPKDWSSSEEPQLTFNQFCHLLKLISLRLEGFPSEVSDEDRLKFLLRIMNRSDGRKKRLSARGSFKLKFEQLETPAFPDNSPKGSSHSDSFRGNKGLGTTTSSATSSPTLTTNSTTSNTTAPVGVSTAKLLQVLPVQLRQNESHLWSMFTCYVSAFSSSRGSNTGNTTTGNTVQLNRDSLKKTTPLLSEDTLWNLLRDFDICPTLCSKSRLNSLVSDCVVQFNSGTGTTLSFLNFMFLMDKIAQDTINATHVKGTPEQRLNALFKTMDKSKGRVKISQLSRTSSVLPSFILRNDDIPPPPPPTHVTSGTAGGGGGRLVRAGSSILTETDDREDVSILNRQSMKEIKHGNVLFSKTKKVIKKRASLSTIPIPSNNNNNTLIYNNLIVETTVMAPTTPIAIASATATNGYHIRKLSLPESPNTLPNKATESPTSFSSKYKDMVAAGLLKYHNKSINSGV